MIRKLVLFGATGDLAGRYLLPALAELQAGGELPDGFVFVGAGRQDWDDERFKSIAAERLTGHASDVPATARRALLDSMTYRRFDVDDHESVAAALRAGASGTRAADAAEPVAAYLALPSGLFGPMVRALQAVRPPPGSRVALEKPFGADLESAVALNRLLEGVSRSAGEHAAFRVDHFLGLASVQSILGLRLGNRMLEPAWNSTYIQQVEIIWEETLALEGRGAYYDAAGQLKDMIQNHLMQVLCLLAMEPPAGLGQRAVSDAKLAVLQATRSPSADEMSTRTSRARYTAGRLPDPTGHGDREVPAYVDEEGVDPGRGTETFAEVALEIDNARWEGAIFVLRTGKALARERMEVVVRFRPAEGGPYAGATNELRIGLGDPGDVSLRLIGSSAGVSRGPVPLEMSAAVPAAALHEYGRVLLDILSGDSTLSVRGDESEEAWRIVTPVLEAWAANLVPLGEYPAGSDGPPRRDAATGRARRAGTP